MRLKWSQTLYCGRSLIITKSGQAKHGVEVPLLGVSDDVRGVAVTGLRYVQLRPPQVGLAKQAEHTQLPVDLWRE